MSGAGRPRRRREMVLSLASTHIFGDPWCRWTIDKSEGSHRRIFLKQKVFLGKASSPTIFKFVATSNLFGRAVGNIALSAQAIQSTKCGMLKKSLGPLRLSKASPNKDLSKASQMNFKLHNAYYYDWHVRNGSRFVKCSVKRDLLAHKGCTLRLLLLRQPLGLPARM